MSAPDVVSVSWWSDLSFLIQSDLKKYLKLCSNISGQVRQMRTQFALDGLADNGLSFTPLLSAGPISMCTALLLYQISQLLGYS